MYKLYVSVKKEFSLLFNDKVGLILMFLMPLLLVFIITIIQDSAFKLINEKKISLLIVNHDKGQSGDKLVKMLGYSGMFDIIAKDQLDSAQIKYEITKGDVLTALYIREDFSESINDKSRHTSQLIMNDLGLSDKKNAIILKPCAISLIHDPVLQDNYCFAIINIIYTHLSVIESSDMMESIYNEVGLDSVSVGLKKTILENRILVNQVRATESEHNEIPNATQHNVPAWTIFAMFFMVVSLGTNIVKERTSGSFLRLKTMPTSFSLVLSSKQFVYIVVAFFQVILIFSVGMFVFPLLHLPALSMSPNIIGTFMLILLSGFAAVSYSIMIGSLVKTHEQANGLGAVSIIIFAAIGGVWVPTFVMPEYMQTLAYLSPLHWCIEGFYVLFLKGGDWYELSKIMLGILIFSCICQLVTYFKLRLEKLI